MTSLALLLPGGTVGSMDRLESTVRELESKLSRMISESRGGSGSSVNLSEQERAKFAVSMVYVTTSLLFVYLKTQGVDARYHPLAKEIERVRVYMQKLKKLIDPTARDDLARSLTAAPPATGGSSNSTTTTSSHNNSSLRPQSGKRQLSHQIMNQGGQAGRRETGNGSGVRGRSHGHGRGGHSGKGQNRSHGRNGPQKSAQPPAKKKHS